MTDKSETEKKGQPGLIPAALFGNCPKCRAQTLFDGPLTFADKCSACGLNFSAYNVGDGPAAFLTLIIGTLVVIMALVVEFNFSPPFWVHILLWLPISFALTFACLRIAKGILITLEHNRSASEGQLDTDESNGDND